MDGLHAADFFKRPAPILGFIIAVFLGLSDYASGLLPGMGLLDTNFIAIRCLFRQCLSHYSSLMSVKLPVVCNIPS